MLTIALYRTGQSVACKAVRYCAIRMLKLGLRLYQHKLVSRERMLQTMALAALLHRYARERTDEPRAKDHRSNKLKHFRRRI